MSEPAGTSPGTDDQDPTVAVSGEAAPSAPGGQESSTSSAPELPDETTYPDHDTWARDVIARLWDKVHGHG